MLVSRNRGPYNKSLYAIALAKKLLPEILYLKNNKSIDVLYSLKASCGNRVFQVEGLG